jgi:hypothetical protein
MDTFFILVAFVFVFAVLAVVAYALFEVSPFAHHKDLLRDPRTGKPRLAVRWPGPSRRPATARRGAIRLDAPELTNAASSRQKPRPIPLRLRA